MTETMEPVFDAEGNDRTTFAPFVLEDARATEWHDVRVSFEEWDWLEEKLGLTPCEPGLTGHDLGEFLEGWIEKNELVRAEGGYFNNSEGSTCYFHFTELADAVRVSDFCAKLFHDATRLRAALEMVPATDAAEGPPPLPSPAPDTPMSAEERHIYAEALQGIDLCRRKGARGTAFILNHRALRAVPPEIGQLKALTFLELVGNRLTALPPEIGQLAALAELRLGGNKLTTLPAEIGQLKALRELSLTRNQLTALPPEIGRLAQLSELDLANNQLTALPPGFGELTALKSLKLVCNNFGALPQEISQLPALAHFLIGGNRLTALPPQIGCLTALRMLFLDSNEITMLPPELGQLAALTYLQLDDNRLTALPPELGGLVMLEVLSVQDNQLTALPPELRQLTGLKELFLHGNPHLGLPADVLGPTREEVLRQFAQPADPKAILYYYFSNR